jgi:hypothetical protein
MSEQGREALPAPAREGLALALFCLFGAAHPAASQAICEIQTSLVATFGAPADPGSRRCAVDEHEPGPPSTEPEPALTLGCPP